MEKLLKLWAYKIRKLVCMPIFGQAEYHFQYKITCVGYDYKETVPSNIVEVSTHYMTDDELLTMVHEATFRYYWDGAEKISGLALENISGRSNMIATGASGFGIMGIISGWNVGL